MPPMPKRAEFHPLSTVKNSAISIHKQDTLWASYVTFSRFPEPSEGIFFLSREIFFGEPIHGLTVILPPSACRCDVPLYAFYEFRPVRET